MGKLTARKVESLSEPGRYSDGDGSGFHLRIDPQGRKYWVLRLHDAAGKRKDISIGPASRVALSAARELARIKRAEYESTGGVQSVALTFEKAAKLTHQSRTVGYRNEKHVTQWLSTLETHAFPLVGAKQISEVSSADVVAVLTPIWLKTPETARRVLQRIDRVLRWAVGNNYRESRIDMALVRDALPRQPNRRMTVRRMPSVPWEAAPHFWQEILLSPSAPWARLALQLQILTAVRPGNIRSARRDQFDLVENVWLIPAEEMKAGVEHRVPLSDAAATVIRAAMALSNHDLLFTRDGGPMSLDTLRMLMRRLGRTETPHGFRSTFKEWARSAGWPDHLSEAALAHVDPNQVRAAYARSDLLEERRPMMQQWASYLQTPSTTSPK